MLSGIESSVFEKETEDGWDCCFAGTLSCDHCLLLFAFVVGVFVGKFADKKRFAVVLAAEEALGFQIEFVG